jgi:hypothetical protein
VQIFYKVEETVKILQRQGKPNSSLSNLDSSDISCALSETQAKFMELPAMMVLYY